MMEAKRFPREEVSWIDSMSEGRWMDLDTAIRRATYEVLLHRSIGYLIYETDSFILLAGSRSEDEENMNVADTMQIPKVAIIGRYTLVSKQKIVLNSL